MAIIIFSDVCNAFFKYTMLPKNKSTSPIARELLNLITDADGVLNSKGQTYIIDRKELIAYFKGDSRIPQNIKNAINNFSVIENIDTNMSDVFDNIVNEKDHINIANELLSLVKDDDCMEETLKNEILSMDLSDPYSIAAKVFIYAIGNDNLRKQDSFKPTPTNKTTEILNNINEMLKCLPQKKKTIIPNEVSSYESNYVKEIIDAISERTNVTLTSQSDLYSHSELSKYINVFDRHRRDFYNAEDIRESLKDSQYEKTNNAFDELKKETYNHAMGLLDDYSYKDSYECMSKVLVYMGNANYSSLISQFPGWLDSSSKKGLCHILVNEKELTWKNE